MREIHSIEEFKKEILERDGLSLVDFKTDWCRHCKLMQPLVDAKEAETGNQILFATVDIEKVKGLSGTFQLIGTPTFIAFKNGKEIGRIVGYNQESTFEKEWKEIFEKEKN